MLSQVKIILVEPAGALNVGSIARSMKNMGLKQLVLVNPQCNPFSEEARRMAVHAEDILEKAQQVHTLPDALVGCQRAIATTARTRHIPTALETPRKALPWLLEADLSAALIFGPEDRGLSNEELNYAQKFVSIPANPDYPTLNLAQSVTVCTYELYQAATTNTVTSTMPQTKIASLDTVEAYYQHLEHTLLTIGYLYPHTASARMEKIRRLYNRAELTPEEVALLRGVLRQIDWLWQLLPTNKSQEKT